MSGFAVSFAEWAVLSFAAFRFTQFFVYDSLIGFSPESGSNTSRRIDSFAYNTDGSNRSFVRGKVGDLLTCPWCLGFWLSVLTYTAFVLATGKWDDAPLVVNVLGMFAVAGGQGFLNSHTE